MQTQAGHWIPGRMRDEYLFVTGTEIVENNRQPSEIPPGIVEVVIMSVPGRGVFVRLYCAIVLRGRDLIRSSSLLI